MQCGGENQLLVPEDSKRVRQSSDTRTLRSKPETVHQGRYRDTKSQIANHNPDTTTNQLGPGFLPKPAQKKSDKFNRVVYCYLLLYMQEAVLGSNQLRKDSLCQHLAGPTTWKLLRSLRAFRWPFFPPKVRLLVRLGRCERRLHETLSAFQDHQDPPHDSNHQGIMKGRG